MFALFFIWIVSSTYVTQKSEYHVKIPCPSIISCSAYYCYCYCYCYYYYCYYYYYL